MSDYKTFETLPLGWTKSHYTDDGVKGPEGNFKWSNTEPPPAIGARVKVTMNNLGNGVVEGYFAESGWLGVLVRLTKPPKWWKEQNKDDLNRLAHIFGTELK